MAAEPRSGSVVLVHGTWSSPADWRFVADDLESAGVEVIAVDLPSMRPESVGVAGFAEDVAATRAAIDAATPPVTVVGWSYGGCWVMTGAVAGVPSVVRAIYLATPPMWEGDPAERSERDIEDLRGDAVVDVRDDGTTAFRNEVLLSEPVQASMPPWMRGHFEAHPRRPATIPRYETVPLPPIWETVPTTVVLGRFEDGITDDVIERSRAHVADTRVWDTDHFPLFRMPHEVAALVLEGFEDDRTAAHG